MVRELTDRLAKLKQTTLETPLEAFLQKTLSILRTAEHPKTSTTQYTLYLQDLSEKIATIVPDNIRMYSSALEDALQCYDLQKGVDTLFSEELISTSFYYSISKRIGHARLKIKTGQNTENMNRAFDLEIRNIEDSPLDTHPNSVFTNIVIIATQILETPMSEQKYAELRGVLLAVAAAKLNVYAQHRTRTMTECSKLKDAVQTLNTGGIITSEALQYYKQKIHQKELSLRR